MINRRGALLLLSAVLLSLPAQSVGPVAPASLLKDINAVADGAPDFLPTNLTVVGNAVFFTSSVQGNGRGLWKSDGTPTGTALLKDLDLVNGLANVGGILFFLADDGIHGTELWKSDGTTAGTVLVKDVAPGMATGPSAAVFNHNGVAYFAAPDGLWKSDGTEAGTVLVKPSIGAGWWMSAGATLYFQGPDPAFPGSELWKTNGTEAGTQLVADLAGDGGSTPVPLFVKNGLLYFSAVTQSQRKLYVTDGTSAGTTLVSGDVNPSGCEHYDSANQVFYFAGTAAATGTGLWKTDGTGPGTVLVKDFNAASTVDNFFANGCLLIGSTLYMSVDDRVSGAELWKSDGTEAGTVLVKDINPGAGYAGPAQFVAMDGLLYFTASDGSTSALWKSDGTGAGTVQAADVQPSGIVALGSLLLFRANDALHGEELWKSDGTTPGTALVKDLRQQVSSLSGRAVYVKALGLAFFAAEDTEYGRELWRTDGTPGGTTRVTDLAAGTGDSSPEYLTSFDGVLYFLADDGVNGRELWKTNGTVTEKVTEIAAPTTLAVVGSTLFVGAADGATTGELWKTDGTAAGTVLVKDLIAGSLGWFFPVGSQLLLVASDNDGTRLWRSDGTLAGTQVLDGNAFFGNSPVGPVSGAVANGFLYYVSQNISLGSGLELFRTDGVGAPTLVKDINPYGGSSHSFPANFVVAGDTMYFTAHTDLDPPNAYMGHELWKTDGTEAGTVLVKDINPGVDGPFIQNMVALNGRVYFTATDGVHSYRTLWVSDGTAAGTTLIKDLAVSEIVTLPAVNRVLLSAWSPSEGGQELWETDGTEAGTVLLQDLQAGAGSSAPAAFTVAGPWLLFSAELGAGDREPWLFDYGASVTEGLTGPVVATPDAGSVENFTTVATPAEAPTTYTYPDGFYAFDVTGLTPGATVHVTLELPSGSTPTAYIKCDGASCAPFTGTTFDGNLVTLTLVDGGAGDADGVADGSISDPGAPAVSSGGGPPPGGGGGDPAAGGGGGGGPFSPGLSLVLLALGALRKRAWRAGAR